jgi:hypothetical protein
MAYLSEGAEDMDLIKSRQTHPWVLLTLLAFTSGNAAAQAKPKAPAAKAHKTGRATAARIRVVPVRYTGACPAKLQFMGNITTDGPAEVRYTWESFDGGTWPQTTIKFTAAGTKPVRESRQMGAPGQVQNGWMQLKVLAPDALHSTQAKFVVACKAPRAAKKQ